MSQANIWMSFIQKLFFEWKPFSMANVVLEKEFYVSSFSNIFFYLLLKQTKTTDQAEPGQFRMENF